MKSIRCAHIVVVSDDGQALVARLRRMDVARITSAADIEEARHLCQANGADACLVAIDESIPDGVPIDESDAPGRCSGVPSLMLVPAVTPHVRAAARRNGYLAAVPAAISSRMLYRRLGAALQRRRAAHRRLRMPAGIGVPLLELPRAAMFGRPTLH